MHKTLHLAESNRLRKFSATPETPEFWKELSQIVVQNFHRTLKIYFKAYFLCSFDHTVEITKLLLVASSYREKKIELNILNIIFIPI